MFASSRESVRLGIEKPDGQISAAFYSTLSERLHHCLPSTASQYPELQYALVELGEGMNIETDILICCGEDILTGIDRDYLDIGIVSSGTIDKWEAAKSTMLRNTRCIESGTIGPSGNQLIIGVAQAFLEQPAQKGNRKAWRNAVIASYYQERPIFTAFKRDTRRFLSKIDLPIIWQSLHLTQRREAIAAQAKLAEAIVIIDSADSVTSMHDNGFQPVRKVSESSIMLITNTWKDKPNRPEKSALARAIVGIPYFRD